ncbi:MAG: SoxR reducing system RseC family protein [candidate division WOR-3 bacterium]|nr:SoxR reducing system RseC family protein [candidate division WOR-3 bacterium]
MEEIGKIIEIEGTTAKIEITPSGGCAHCTQANICNPLGKNKKVIELQNNLNAQVGDWVKIEIKEKHRVLSLSLVLGLPVVLFLIGVFFGRKISSEKFSAILGGVGLGLGFLVVKIINNYLIKKGKSLATIKEKISPPNGGK